MRFLFYFGHPAHYHMFKNTIVFLKAKGYEVDILIKSKDILENLLTKENIKYINVLPEGRKNSKLHILWGLIKRVWRIGRFVVKNRPDVLIGSEPSLSYVGKLFNIPSLIFVEDDAHVIPYFAKITFPLATYIIAPHSCDLGKWENKKIGYHGFQKLPYLHPNQFKPEKQKVQHLFGEKGKYFIIRAASLKAHHDFGIKGLTTELIVELINLLEAYGHVYISAEVKLDERLSPYELHLNIEDIHHALFYADMFVGDSQSMAVEAALLGTPSVRFSDFAGRIGVLEELEKKYNLTFGIPASQPEQLINKVKELLLIKNLKQEFGERRKVLLADKIDTSAFFSWFIESYPQSAVVMKEKPEYQNSFK